MKPDVRDRADDALRPLTDLRMAIVQSGMYFDKMIIRIGINSDLTLLVIVTDNPVRATIDVA